MPTTGAAAATGARRDEDAQQLSALEDHLPEGDGLQRTIGAAQPEVQAVGVREAAAHGRGVPRAIVSLEAIHRERARAHGVGSMGAG